MLDRLETAFETQNNFVSNASHELGTPLTAIIGEAELALRGERDNESLRASISFMLTEAERLNHISAACCNWRKPGSTVKSNTGSSSGQTSCCLPSNR